MNVKHISWKYGKTERAIRQALARELQRRSGKKKVSLKTDLRRYQEIKFPCHICKVRMCDEMAKQGRSYWKCRIVDKWLRRVEPPRSMGKGGLSYIDGYAKPTRTLPKREPFYDEENWMDPGEPHTKDERESLGRLSEEFVLKIKWDEQPSGELANWWDTIDEVST